MPGFAAELGSTSDAALAAGRRRIDKRVTASTKPRAKTARPAIWASATGVSSETAAVSASRLAPAFLVALAGLGAGTAGGAGSRVGNKLAALLAAGLSEGSGAGKLGRLPTGRGSGGAAAAGGAAWELGLVPADGVPADGAAAGAALAWCDDGARRRLCAGAGEPVVAGDPAEDGDGDPVAVGSAVGCAELGAPGDLAGVGETAGSADPVEVVDGDGLGEPEGLADVGAGTVTATVAETVGAFGRLAASPVTVRRTDPTRDAAAGTVSCAWSCRCADRASTAPRSHEDLSPRRAQPKLKYGVMPLAGVACRRSVASGTWPPVVQALTVHWTTWPRSPLACAGVTLTQSLTCLASNAAVVAVCVAVAACVARVPAGAGDRLSVRVGLGEADEAVAEGDALMVLVAVADGDGGADFRADGAGLAVGFFVGVAFFVVGVGAGFVAALVAAGLDAKVRVGAGVALEGAGASGSQDVALLPVVVAAGVASATVVLAAMAKVTPEAAVARTVPAIRVTVAGPACAKRMKRPASAARCFCGTTCQYGMWRYAHLLDIRWRSMRHPASYPVGRIDHRGMATVPARSRTRPEGRRVMAMQLDER